MNRRRFLALCGAGAVSVAGCMADGGGSDGDGDDGPGDGDGTDAPTDGEGDGTPTDGDDGTPTDGDDGTPTGGDDGTPTDDDPLAVGDAAAIGDGSVRVAEVVVQESFVHLTSPDSKGVSADGQYLFARVALGEGLTLDQDFLSLQVGGTETGPTEPYGYGYHQIDAGQGEPYRPDEGGGWVLFELSESLEAPAGSLTATVDGKSVSWTLPEAALAELRRAPPSFELRSFTAEPAGDETVRFTVEVENVADVPGTFRAAVNQSGPGYAPMATAAVEVDAGATETWEVTEDVFGSAEGTHRYSLHWSGDAVYRDVDFGGGTTTG